MSSSQHQHVPHTIGWRQRLAHLQGSPVAFDLRAYDQQIAEINRRRDEVNQLSERELEGRARQLRAQVQAGSASAEPPRGYTQPSGKAVGTARESVRAALFALAREASWRVLGLRPFDEQVLAALALDDGHIVEMQTGEGKTLAAVMPASLRALTGQGVHVLTFNDYLARRDAEWMGPVYARLGLSVGFVQQSMTPEARRHAYLADVT
jgi:preprotein translocase subunit SecA